MGVLTLFVIAIVVLTVLGLGILWVNKNVGARIQRDGFEYQETAREQVIDQYDDILRVDSQIADPDTTDEQRVALEAQRSAMVDQLCSIANKINGDAGQASVIISQEC